MPPGDCVTFAASILLLASLLPSLAFRWRCFAFAGCKFDRCGEAGGSQVRKFDGCPGCFPRKSLSPLELGEEKRRRINLDSGGEVLVVVVLRAEWILMPHANREKPRPMELSPTTRFPRLSVI